MPGPSRIFELRTYTATAGKRPALERRFRDHTVELFERHGIDVVAFFAATDDPDVLVYILGYPDAESTKTHWAAFQADPEWIKAKAESEVDGVLVANIESAMLTATDFSAIH